MPGANHNIKTVVSRQLIGVVLVGETFKTINTSAVGGSSNISTLPLTSYRSLNNQNFISTYDVIVNILVENTSCTIDSLRTLISNYAPNLPTNYCFLSRNDCELLKTQEHCVKVCEIVDSMNLIRIRRQFNKPRIGVLVRENNVIQPAGFIFVDLNVSVSEVRREILEQLGGIWSEGNANHNFIFQDKNMWPVTTNQENQLVGWDIYKENCFTVSTRMNRKVERSDEIDDVDNKNRSKKRRKNNHDSEVREEDVVEAHSSISLNRNLIYQQSHSTEGSKHILISYVRAESAHHAVDLKRQLKDMGFSVYLDIDEIYGGHDWQDALNAAVTNCEIFIPLITQQYGRTQWTNREVKLADLMAKVIIPVNFLDYWPPECLAIQFSSVQYIPWKSSKDIEEAKKNGEEKRATDIRFWDLPYVKQVAEAITERCKTLITQNDTDAKEEPSLKPQLRSCPSLVSEKFPEINLPREGKPLVVISVHPNQQDFAEHLRLILYKVDCEVWCSTDILRLTCSGDEVSSATSGSPQTPSTPILESLHTSTTEGFNDVVTSQCESSNESFKFFHWNKRPSLQFSFSTEGGISLSQGSDYCTEGSTCTLSTVSLDRMKLFRKQANEAGVAILILSEAYCNSKTSLQQAFYCELRKRVILVKYEDILLSSSLSVLFENEMFDRNKEAFSEDIRKQVEISLKSPLSKELSCEESNVQKLVFEAEKKIVKRLCVYICGSSKFFNPKSEAICHAIGSELASLRFVSLISNGFYGVGEAVSRSFCEERELLQEKPQLLYHILPLQDSEDLSKKTRQNREYKTFYKVPYGQTIFIGNSMKQRNSVIARLIDICILVEGGPRTVQEIEELMWNDHVVIPVMCTGGAAAGQFNAPTRMTEVPPGVSEGDWITLTRTDVTAEDIAQAVKRVVCSLKRKKCRDLRMKKLAKGKQKLQKKKL
ncbi:uncharacterized protein LOC106470075 isoform X1 [Limulus polyphemus]|uniref:Uncharacterized protein LOC106470075 isoform X1 n=2 Tax=Limulus polyphemus TaxID=6850 RepID=A0ABM1BPB8_LIMPO|nr:uncharacterized protein LOC106470075 isoform X1 [Limulus polyphemus]